MRLSSRDLFQTAHTEGGLLPADLLQRVADGDGALHGLNPSDYHLAPGERLGEAVTRSWTRLTGAWQAFDEARQALPSGDTGGRITRERWLHVLFDELGYGRLVQQPAIEIDGKSFPVFSQWQHTPIHLVGCRVKIDARTPGVKGAAGQSPHSLLQELLNRSNERLWGIVSNGLVLRILRDNVSLTRQTYLEFDLEAMFTGEVYSDFVLLWLICHQSRVEADRPEDCWLERWGRTAVEDGTRALDALRQGVEEAIETLGAGFLAHPANHALHKALHDGTLGGADYYRALLRLVYRLLFLFVAEDRDVLLDPAGDPIARDRYLTYYSTRGLRTLATRRRGGRQHDRYEQLKVVMNALDRDGCSSLALPPLGSFLWSAAAVGLLADAQLANDDLLDAVRSLATIDTGGVRRAVDFRNLGAEELGSVYESLLELHPSLDRNSATFLLEEVSGSERKTTGSYYTPTSLISSVLDAALEPLLDEAATSADPERAILSLSVVDPACGSGHFLIAAANRIAKRLASIRSEDPEPAPEIVRAAVRDVIGHCVYGIDVNPMAVELCKVSLWLEALEPGKPLSFLDHHIAHGNGLLGATPRLLAGGVPDAAFTAIEGDDKPTLASRRKVNATQRDRRSQILLDLPLDPGALAEPIAAEMARLEALPDDTAAQVAEKARQFAALEHEESTRRARLAADTWCAAFVAIKTREHPAITDETVRIAASNPAGLTAEQRAEIEGLTAEYRFLHWHLAFPQIFDVDLVRGGDTGCVGGFDLILGNPPWETMSPDRREFMAPYIPGIRAMSPKQQDEAIDEALADPRLADLYRRYRRNLFGQVHFLKNSRRYTLYAKGNLGKGDFNIYRNFVETALRNTRPGGFASQVTPGGLYGGANASAIRHHLLDECQLSDLFGLINTKRGWFAEVDIDRFAAYAARPGGRTDSFRARFGLADAADLGRPPVEVSADLIREQAPATYAIPDIRNAFEMTVAAKMVASHRGFGDLQAGPPIRHYQREVDMGNDTGLFTTDPSGLPVYEGRMIDHFDHRAKSYVSGHGNSARWDEHDFGDPAKAIVPQWRILRRDIPSKLGDRCDHYRIGFGDVANPRNERSFVAALIPRGVICGHKVPTIRFDQGYEWAYLPWLAVANSFAMDWLTRTRLSSPTLSYTVMDNLPFPRFPPDHQLVTELAPLVLRLTCTSPEMTGYWNTMSEHGWCSAVADGTVPGDALIDPAARADARAQVDAIVARHVFELARDELAYVLDQFPVLEKRDRKAHGGYATKDRILRWYERV